MTTVNLDTVRALLRESLDVGESDAHAERDARVQALAVVEALIGALGEPAGSYRVGRHQAHNIYRVTADCPEGRQIGAMFDPADGPLVVAALNAFSVGTSPAHPVLDPVVEEEEARKLDVELAAINARVAADKRIEAAAVGLCDAVAEFEREATVIMHPDLWRHVEGLRAAVDARREVTGDTDGAASTVDGA